MTTPAPYFADRSATDALFAMTDALYSLIQEAANADPPSDDKAWNVLFSAGVINGLLIAMRAPEYARWLFSAISYTADQPTTGEMIIDALVFLHPARAEATI